MPITLFDPQSVPVKGLHSYPAPSSLQPGEWQDLQNVRWDDRSIRARPGCYREMTHAPTGTVYGGTIFRRNNSGDVMAICAIDVGASVVKIYYESYNGTVWSGGWTQISGLGADPSTFSIPKYGYYEFSCIQNRDLGVMGVYVQNGTDNASYIDLSLFPSPIIYKITDLSFPKQAATATSMAKATGYVNVRSGGMLAGWPAQGTHYNSEGTFDPATAAADEGNLQQSGSTPEFYWLLTAGGAAGTSIPTVDDYAWFQSDASSDGDFSGGDQVLVPYVASDNTWFTCCKWYLTGTTAGALLIHDPSNFKDTSFRVATKNGVKMVVFSIADHAASTLTDITGLKLVVTNAGLTPGATLEIRGVVCGGRAPGTRQHAVSFGSGSNTSESPGVLLDARATMQPMINAGCSVSEEVLFPVDERIKWAFDVPVFAPTAAQAALWANVYNVYARDPGEEEVLFGNGENGDFSYIGQVTVSLYDTGSGNGPGATDRLETPYATFGNNETAWSQKAVAGTFVDTVAQLDKTFEKRCPGPYTVSMPVGSSLVYANGQMYVAGARGASSAQRNNGVYVSEKDYPGRYSPVPGDDSDVGRGILISLEDENGLKVHAVSASMVGVATVLCWTDRAVYNIEDTFAVRIADHGTVAPQSIASANGYTYWVDQDLVVCEMGSTIRGISRYAVHNKLTAVPQSYRKYMSGAMHRGRYFLSRASASSNANHRILVYNPDEDAWESDDSVPTTVPCSQFFVWRYASASRLMFFTDDGEIWEYDREGTVDDNGTTIALALRSGEITQGWDNVFIGQASIVCSDQNSRTMTVTRTARKPTGTSVGTLTTDAGGSETSAYRVDTDATDGFAPGIEGCSVDVNFAVSVQHPFSIHSIKVEGASEASAADNG